MAEFQEVMRHANRLCGGFENCRECPIEEIGLCGAIDCNAAKAERIIMDWAAANPEPKYPTWGAYLCSLYPGTLPPDATIKSMPADIAKKLGVEPIREDK